MGSLAPGELRSQAIQELARDPDSKVTAEDAQKTIMEEARRAGAPTMHFDPNASTAEKVAQATDQLGPPHPHLRKHAMGITTDVDDGTPAPYDLPPPEPASALVPSNEDKAADETAPEEDWSHVGWKPRFGDGMTEEERKDNRTLLDHQTFLEGKLDEKFYGDWYHNTGVIIFACLASWIVAFVGGGLGWVFIIMACCGTYYRTSIRRVRRNFRDDIRREVAKARPEFHTETLYWINDFLDRFWPIFAPNLARTVIQMVDQILSGARPAFLEDLKLSDFTLGTKPPYLEHVASYRQTSDDEIVMDWKFAFTPNDTVDMTKRQLQNKINPKVVLEIRVGVGIASKALKVIVEDFSFSGLMRVKLKLQRAWPHVERADICFIGQPDIDYVCKPLGGETFGFDINFIPGLSDFIKGQVHANLGPMMYDPNVFPIEIAKMMSGSPVDMAIGVVAVTLHGAAGLKNPDKFSGTPDPYAVVSLNNSVELGRTQTVRENASPRWNETIFVIISNFSDALTTAVFDYNEVRKDKELGMASFPLERLEIEHEHENLQLEVNANGKARGIIQADFRYFPVLKPTTLPDKTVLPPPETNTGVARITIEQCKDLDGSKSMVGKLNPYAVLLINGKEIHSTKKLKRTNNPIFENPTKSLLITDRKKARIGLVIKDDRDLAADPVVGNFQIKLDDLKKALTQGQEWFTLHGAKTGKVKLLIDWKPVAMRGISGGSGGYLTPIGVMRIHIQSARNLRNLETIGKSDPYTRVLLSGIPKGRTVTFMNELNPSWDEVIYVPMHSRNEKLTLEVMDQENLGKDRSLGLVEVDAADYIVEEEDGSYRVHNVKSPLSSGLRMNPAGAERGTLNYTVSFYPTFPNVVDPEEEEEERQIQADMDAELPTTPSHNKQSFTDRKLPLSQEAPSTPVRKSLEPANRPSLSVDGRPTSSAGSSTAPVKKLPKVRLEAEDLQKYESGLIVFKLLEGNFAQSNLQLEVIIDDQYFPNYTSSKARGKHHVFGETGDAFVRELDMSRITMRLAEKTDTSGGNKKEEERIVAKVEGSTLQVLQQALYKPHTLTLRGSDGGSNKITVQLRYLPVKMTLDPSESINNSGSLRVDVFDAAELPAADRNGYSDPYCKFQLNGKDVYKTKTQKKTLHPSWNEFFEVDVPSRTAAQFRCDVYDWDFGEKADYLGGADIKLDELEPFKPEERTYRIDGKSGAVRLKMLFKPAYVTRTRQGSSTLQGTFAPAGKVVGAPVKGATKGLIGGAKFLRRGFTQRHSKDEPMPVNGVDYEDPGMETETGATGGAAVIDNTTSPDRAAAFTDGTSTPITPTGLKGPISPPDGTPRGELGTANFIIVSASGYPPHAEVQVSLKLPGAGKVHKEVLKTKPIKSSTGEVQYDGNRENIKVSCTADTQFMVMVKDQKIFGSKDLGEGILFVSDQGAGSEQRVTVGEGTVVVRTSFTRSPAADASSLRPSMTAADSPDSRRDGGHRRSFFGRREVSSRHEAQ